MLGHIDSESKIHIEKGFFAKSSFREIAAKLNTVNHYRIITPWNFLENAELQQLIVYERMTMEYDISGQNALTFDMHTKYLLP